MANTKISQLTALTNPTGSEELVYAYNNSNGKMTLNTMKSFANTGQQAELVSGVNIKTINNTSILGSGNIDVSGGGGGSFEPTELSGDANIWELSDGVYKTTYNLYYKTGEALPTSQAAGVTRKQLLFINSESNGAKGFFSYNVYHSSINGIRASYGYSASSSEGLCNALGERDWALKHYNEGIYGATSINSLNNDNITQVIDNVNGNQTIGLASGSQAPYPGVTYTVLVNSIASGQTYTVSLGTGVTNPLNVTLPSASNKKCVITFLVTSTTTAVVTGCTLESSNIFNVEDTDDTTGAQYVLNDYLSGGCPIIKMGAINTYPYWFYLASQGNGTLEFWGAQPMGTYPELRKLTINYSGTSVTSISIKNYDLQVQS